MTESERKPGSQARTAALVVAAGRGARFGGNVPKQYRPLAGRPLLRHSLETLLAHPGVEDIRAVIHPEDRERYDDAAAGLGLSDPVVGGAARQDSVRLGLESLAGCAPDYVLIHDAARPLLDRETISRVLAALASHAGAIPAIPVRDTVKRAEQRVIVETLPRAGLWLAQTPQGFRFAHILAIHQRFTDDGDFTDDAGLAEAAKLTLAVVDGDEENIKVTEENDLARAERILERRFPAETRIGTGFDVHRFGPGAAVRLCGVDIPFERGLMGHSDADVGLHALTDAILGAFGAGDIGSHFSPSDEAWRGADSAHFLRHAANLAAARGGATVNVDVTLICERPKVAAYRGAMVERIAGLLGIDPARVNVKATTTEGLGFAGRGEGVAAQATAAISVAARPG